MRVQDIGNIICVAVVVLGLVACKKSSAEQEFTPPPPTEEQKRNIEAMMEREKYRDLPDCEGEAKVLMGPYVFIVPRKDGISLNRINRKNAYDYYGSLRRPQPDADCNREFFDDVSGISMLPWNTPEMIDRFSFGYFPDPGPINGYDGAMQTIEKFKMTKTVLKNGIEYYESDGDLVFYILPEKVASTRNKKPIVFSCSKSSKKIGECHTRYVLPNGISLSYGSIRNPDKFFDIERSAREFVLGMIYEDLSNNGTREAP